MLPWNPRATPERGNPQGASQEAPLPGVIDTLGEAFALLVSRPWAILPVVAVDLLVSFGPRITLKPFVDTIGPASQYDGVARTLVQDLEAVSDLNATGFVALGSPLARMPALTNDALGADVAPGMLAGTVSSLPVLVLGFVVLVLIALSFICVAWHRMLLQQAVVQAPVTRRTLLPPGVLPQTGRLVGLAVTLSALLVLVTLPIVLMSVASAVIGLGGSGLLVLLASLPLAWSLLFFAFSVPAMVMDDLGVMAGLRASFQVVRTYFWATVRFTLVTLIIGIGLLVIFQALSSSVPGLLLAVTGNAFIASGMLAATMLFYRDRARRLGVVHRPGIS